MEKRRRRDSIITTAKTMKTMATSSISLVDNRAVPHSSVFCRNTRENSSFFNSTGSVALTQFESNHPHTVQRSVEKRSPAEWVTDPGRRRSQ